MKKIILAWTLLLATNSVFSQLPNTWTQKADFGGTARYAAVGFSIGGKGYLGTGYDTTGEDRKDFWEYDPDADTWTQKANFKGHTREHAVGFSIGNKGYLGTGIKGITEYKDFWEYDPNANTWTQKADFGGNGRYNAVGFSIGSRGYVGTGIASVGGQTKDFWEYDPNADTWTQKADFGGNGGFNAVGFSIGSKGYLGTGNGAAFEKDFWEYNPDADTWTQKADFGGTGRVLAVGFSIGSKGYLGTGFSNDGTYHYYKDFWEYDPVVNTWTQKADFGGTERFLAAGFSIGSKGYVGTGLIGSSGGFKDFWEYTPDAPSCTVPTNLSATNITSSSATLNWNAVSGAEKYKVRYRVSGTSQWTTKNSIPNSITITSLLSNTKYTWQVKTICTNESSDWSEKEKFKTSPLKLAASQEEALFDVYPNPFSSFATISFSLQHDARVQIELYDVAGKKLQTLFDENTEAGDHILDLNRDQLNAGIYFLKLRVNESEMMKKLIIQ